MSRSGRSIRSTRPAGAAVPTPIRDPAILEGYLEDASGASPGIAAGLLRVAAEAEASAYLRATAGRGVAILPQAARTSLTGGAVPHGTVVLSVERMATIGAVETWPGGARVSVEAGVRLKDLQTELAGRGWYYPPVPTYLEAMIGGTVSTNAGGAATFKYGVTRQWVHGLRVVLYNGDVLELRRGHVMAGPGESFEIDLVDGGRLEIPVPDYRLPDLKKITAGYHSADPLDLVDVLIGSEGTLGLITTVTVDLVPLPATVLTGLVFLSDPGDAVPLAGRLRQAAIATRQGENPDGPDIRAIESVDQRCLGLLREHGDVARLRIQIPSEARAALLFEMEVDRSLSDDDVLQGLQDHFDREHAAPAAGGGPTPITALLAILDEFDALDDLQLALPQDPHRRDALLEFREAVPKRVNEILVARRRQDPEVRKVGGDPIVPFEHLPEMIGLYERELGELGLEYAVWGHVSDGNLHPNVLARDGSEVAAAERALMVFADAAIRLGGSPLSEHGVGRSRLKQAMVERFLGAAAIRAMRAVKRGFDPEYRFAPGVLFPER